MKVVFEEYNWDLKYGEIVMIFCGGCIICVVFFQKIKEVYDCEFEFDNFFFDSYFKNIVESY